MAYFPSRNTGITGGAGAGGATGDQWVAAMSPYAQASSVPTGIPKSVGSSPGSPAPQVDMSTPGDYRTQAEKDKVKLLEDQRQLEFEKQRRAFDQERKAFDAEGAQPAPAAPGGGAAGGAGGGGATGAPGAGPGPAVQALQRAMEPSSENWDAVATPSLIRPGLGDRLPVQRQALFTGGAIY